MSAKTAYTLSMVILTVVTATCVVLVMAPATPIVVKVPVLVGYLIGAAIYGRKLLKEGD